MRNVWGDVVNQHPSHSFYWKEKILLEEDNVRTITITLTQACNQSCVYCYEHHKSDRQMAFDTAKEIIDRELAVGDVDYERLEFDLFGGEPFLAFDLLCEVTDYICEKKGKRNCVVFASTNGTLVHGEVQNWLRGHADCFVCGLSLDGTRKMHNLNRSNSYDDIDLDFFREMYPEQDVKMTISQETLPMLSEGVIDIHQKGFRVSCNLAYEIDWSDPENADILCRELTRLIDFYLKNPEIKPCSMLEMGIHNIGVSDDAIRYCGAGNHMRSYDVDGQCYPCQFFMPLSVGAEKAAASQNLSFPDDVISPGLLDEKCRDCIIRSSCPNCFGANYAATGSIYRRDENMCRLTKIIMKARSLFRARQWEAGQLNMDQAETQTVLRAVVRIQEELWI